jgi:hypothetical protein
VLINRGKTLGVIEAKKRVAALTEGLGQAKAYAAKLQTRYAYSTNGRSFYQVDMETGAEGEIAAFPTPEALWTATYADENTWRDRFAATPLSDYGGNATRYYQSIAIERVLEGIGAGDKRILLTLATGTGKPSSPFNSLGSSSRRAGISVASQRGAHASSSSRIATSWPTKPTTRSRLSPKIPALASRPMKSARPAACRRTPISSSRSSRPSCRARTRTAPPRRTSMTNLPLDPNNGHPG